VVVVFDSGVWISAFQFAGIPLAALKSAFVYDQIAYCDQILAEIRAVLARKFSWQDEEVRSLLEEYLSAGTRVEINGSLHGICRDRKDDFIFECATSANAEIIVSGDRDLLIVRNCQNIRVLTPRQYLDREQFPRL
jgi:putative PIN family toxin of toxin-antitoxin system